MSNPFAEAKVDSNSAVADDVARMARESRTYPSFADIPPPPTGQRPVASWGKAADQLEVAGAQLDRNTAPNTWTLGGTDRFVARARAQAGPDIGTSGASTTPSSEAFAKELRERATPPPSPR